MKHVPPPAGEPLVDVPLPPTEQHAEALKALARLRKEAAAEVERLLTFLDETDGDADLEPSLGSVTRPGESQAGWAAGNADELEDEVGLELTGQDDDEDGRDDEPEVDSEPALGSFDRMTNQEKSWRQASLVAGSDHELDDCDREDDDPAEVGEVSGIGDWDGVLEQIGGHHSTHGRVID